MSDEFYRDLGERIRRRRKERGLTQAQLADGFITRNMICRIENGDAAPSIPTLRFLSERLGVPIGYFFAKSRNEEALYVKSDTVSDIRNLFYDGMWDECAELCASRSEFDYDDEIVLIRAVCLIRRSEELEAEYRLASARAGFVAAAEIMANSSYLTDYITKYASFHCALIDSATGPISDECFSEEYRESGAVSPEMHLFLLFLKSLDSEGISENTKRISQLLAADDHISFCESIFALDGGDAAARIPELEGLSRSSEFIIAYRSSVALESAYEKSGDYRAAYLSAKRRLDLLKLFAL